jgi:hypothetical protein
MEISILSCAKKVKWNKLKVIMNENVLENSMKKTLHSSFERSENCDLFGVSIPKYIYFTSHSIFSLWFNDSWKRYQIRKLFSIHIFSRFGGWCVSESISIIVWGAKKYFAESLLDKDKHNNEKNSSEFCVIYFFEYYVKNWKKSVGRLNNCVSDNVNNFFWYVTKFLFYLF